MLYDIMGTVSSVLFIGCLWGLYKQILEVRRRKTLDGKPVVEPGYATRSLSANGFASSFVAFFSFFVYSMSLGEIEPFIFGTRLAASLATLYVLYEIYRDRTSRADRLPFQIASTAMMLSFFVLAFREQLLPYSSKFSATLAIFSTIVMFQGGISQIRKILAERSTAALSLQMTFIFFLKDVSNVAFGLVLGVKSGWPLILMGGVSAGLKGTNLLLFTLFPRERVS